jgi:aromatic ring-opening dioxygenase LigB subunit
MFINILQGLHPFEAEILCLVKDKRLEEKYKITKEVVSEAYPDIQWGGRS